MPNPITLLGIAGSLRRDSYNRAANRPEVMIGSAAKAFDAEGRLTDEASLVLIRQLLVDLVAWTRRLGTAPALAE